MFAAGIAMLVAAALATLDLQVIGASHTSLYLRTCACAHCSVRTQHPFLACEGARAHIISCLHGVLHRHGNFSPPRRTLPFSVALVCTLADACTNCCLHSLLSPQRSLHPTIIRPIQDLPTPTHAPVRELTLPTSRSRDPAPPFTCPSMSLSLPKHLNMQS